MKELALNNVPVKIWAKTLDPFAWRQISNLASLPFVYHHIAIMPDVHAGTGMPIGGVLATVDAVIPNAVGVDIGCGMCAVKTSLKASEIPSEVMRKQILRGVRRQIPIGVEHHKHDQEEKYLPQGFELEKLTVVNRNKMGLARQVGTLGGGNHFIEFQRDGEDNLWIMLHSGSRNLGKQVGDYYNEMAANLNRKYHSSVNPEIKLPFLPKGTDEFKHYWDEMRYCIEFAFCNRRLMMERIMEVIKDAYPEAEFEPMINIAHNYAAFENHFGQNVIVHRKGAVRAAVGVTGIIPGSQGTCSYIVEGLGNEDSFMSSSHGAGRLMSRTEAVNTLSLEDEIASLDEKGIIHAIRCRNDLEEAASAYKDIDEVLANEQDLVRIVTKLWPVAVIKG